MPASDMSHCFNISFSTTLQQNKGDGKAKTKCYKADSICITKSSVNAYGNPLLKAKNARRSGYLNLNFMHSAAVVNCIQAGSAYVFHAK